MDQDAALGFFLKCSATAFSAFLVCLLQFLEPQVTPMDLGADQFFFPADAVHLEADETLGGETVLEVGAGYAVKPGFDGIAATLDADLVPFARLVNFLPGLGEG